MTQEKESNKNPKLPNEEPLKSHSVITVRHNFAVNYNIILSFIVIIIMSVLGGGWIGYIGETYVDVAVDFLKFSCIPIIYIVCVLILYLKKKNK